jgi:hypothetical protein
MKLFEHQHATAAVCALLQDMVLLLCGQATAAAAGAVSHCMQGKALRWYSYCMAADILHIAKPHLGANVYTALQETVLLPLKSTPVGIMMGTAVPLTISKHS